jgi:NAD(P)-dependent dehydrogenase (short-subunit alcohol dehydrogenase family)
VVAQSFLALLRAGTNPRIVNISSGSGSLTRRTEGGEYSYAASKAALNMVTRVLAGNMRGEGITAVMISPGWVKTDMGGPNARLEPAESARGLLSVIDGLTPADSGRFLSYDGSELPW